MTMEQLNTAKQVLLEDMKDYLDLFTEDNCKAPYAIADVDRCGAILDDYLSHLFTKACTNDEIISEVEATVKALNKLNDLCGGGLIETDQREQFCTIIIEAARLCDYPIPDDDDDITFEWRNW